jgi:hypothetical protein
MRNKEKAAMRSTIRQISVVLLLAVLLAPGLVLARTPVRHVAQSSQAVSRTAPASIFSLAVVRDLLTRLMKTGPTLDPSGGTGSGTGTGTSAPSGDTGSVLDPSGTK